MGLNIDNYTKLLSFSIISVMSIGMAIFMYVVAHDYLFITMYDIMLSLETSGLFSSNWLPVFEQFITDSLQMVALMDYIWFGIFISLVAELFIVSYKSKREGYPAVFGFLFYGVMIFLFVASIFEKVTGYLYNIFFNAILENISSQILFFDFYIANFSLINLVIVVICVILNIVDFNFVSYNARKTAEIGNTENTREL